MFSRDEDLGVFEFHAGLEKNIEQVRIWGLWLQDEGLVVQVVELYLIALSQP